MPFFLIFFEYFRYLFNGLWQFVVKYPYEILQKMITRKFNWYLALCSSQSKYVSNFAQIRAVLVRRKIENGSHDFDSFNFPGIIEAIQVRKVASMNFMKALFFRSYARKVVVDATAHTRLTLMKRFTNLNLSRRQKNQAILCRDFWNIMNLNTSIIEL